MSLVLCKAHRQQLYKFFRPCLCSNFHIFSNLHQQQSEELLVLQNEKVERYLRSLRQEFYNLKATSNSNSCDFRRIRQLSEIVSAYEQRNSILNNMSSLKDIENEKDPDMKELINEEKEVYRSLLADLDTNIIKQLLKLDNNEQYSSLYFEISAGVGGQEAMLFASDMFDMYTGFFGFKRWEYELVHFDKSEIGGLRHATILVQNAEAYSALKYEGGVHRVQRVPATEKSGRIHTSTVTVAIIPCPDDVDTVINEKDLKIETKRASGAGGQHVNTTDSAVRIFHIPTGTVVECQTDRSQVKNKEIAMKKLRAKLVEEKVQSLEASKVATRKAQVGTSNRNEKIRTYNFIQDRITDHRIKGGTLHNLGGFLAGREPLDNLINQLVIAERRSCLLHAIESVSECEEK